MRESYLFVVIAIYAVMVGLMYSFLIIKRRERKNMQKGAYKILTEGFNNNVPIDDAEIKLICKKYRFPSYVFLLERYLLYLRDGHTSDLDDFEKVNSFLKSEIAKEHAARPYDGIEESERRIMLSIEETANDDSIKRIIKNNLNELSDSIRKNENNLRKAKKMNNWMIPLTVISFFLTVVTYFWGSKLSQNDFDELDNHFSTILEEKIHPLEESINASQIPAKINE